MTILLNEIKRHAPQPKLDPLHILMTADTIGGVWTYALELARALAAWPITITLAAMGRTPTAAQIAAVDALPHVLLVSGDFKLEWMCDPWVDVARAGDWLLELADALEPDLIHLNNYAHGDLPWQAPVLVVGHSCVLSWWQSVKGEPAPPRWDRYRQEVTAGLQAADAVLAPTVAMLAALAEHYGPLPRSGVVANGRSGQRFSPAAKEPIIFASGRLWDEAKNIAALTEIAPALPWPVYIAGNDEHPAGKQMALPNVETLGYLSAAEMASWMGRAAVYALPAYYEPFGLSPLEAALSGCALVLGEIPSLQEVWGDAAYYVPPEEPAALRAALQELIEDEELRKTMALRARSRALLYNPQQKAARYLSWYQSLIAIHGTDPVSKEFAPVCTS
ncbi:MAG: glycosyltransferase family 4 protein [Candidatus Promineifilaceae bacterium]|nr:glycosyltransferase family 4 protein [Candidatus Promineifilaceae bacterium]